MVKIILTVANHWIDVQCNSFRHWEQPGPAHWNHLFVKVFEFAPQKHTIEQTFLQIQNRGATNSLGLLTKAYNDCVFVCDCVKC